MPQANMPLAATYQAPAISVVPPDLPRPRWSVMIPTYNCALYLRKTLESVLAQDPGPHEMQIEVIDDCSMQDDPEAVVQEVGKGRVTFYRRPQNGGVVANFNTCIERSRGHLIHILHGDDYVLPGFYSHLTTLAEQYSDVALLASRAFVVDVEGIIIEVTVRLPELESSGHSVESFFYRTPLQTPGVVVRRNFYEENGGFLPALPHAADREMWARAIGASGGVVTKEVLACYRTFAANDSGRLARSAENLRDMQRLNQLFAQRYATFDPAKALYTVCQRAWIQERQFTLLGDREAVTLNAQFWRTNAPFYLKMARFFEESLWGAKRILRKLLEINRNLLW